MKKTDKGYTNCKEVSPWKSDTLGSQKYCQLEDWAKNDDSDDDDNDADDHDDDDNDADDDNDDDDEVSVTVVNRCLRKKNI